jgi:membrane protein DedA with SNARE-associated domain
VTKLLIDYGLVLVFLVVALESAGLPFLPGELALISAALLAQPSQHHFSILSVVVVAAAGAITGFSVGYWIGRLGGRRLLERWGFVARYANKVLPPSERFFARHGTKTVFFGRFVAILRATVGWLAGITHMGWWKFFGWNVAGGVVWAVGYGLLAYYAGRAAVDAVSRYGTFAIVGVVVAVGLVFFGMRYFHRRMEGTGGGG